MLSDLLFIGCFYNWFLGVWIPAFAGMTNQKEPARVNGVNKQAVIGDNVGQVMQVF